MIRSFNPEDFRKAAEPYPEILSPSFDFESWVGNTNNVMYVEEDGSVGLCTYEYPGLFTVHWYFKAKGREALNLAVRMLDDLFTNYGAKAVRGLTKVQLKAAKWAARKIGMKSYGVVKFPTGEYELLYMTKDEFYSYNKKEEQ